MILVSLGRYLLVACTAVFLSACMCLEARKPFKNPDYLSRWGLSLLPRELAQPAKMKDATIVDCSTSDDIRQIAELIGRIQGVSHDVLEIKCVWLEAVVAARVILRTHIVYVVKDSDYLWKITAVVVYVPERARLDVRLRHNWRE